MPGHKSEKNPITYIPHHTTIYAYLNIFPQLASRGGWFATKAAKGGAQFAETDRKSAKANGRSAKPD